MTLETDNYSGKYQLAGLREFGVYPTEEIDLYQQHPLAIRWVENVAEKVTKFGSVCFVACGNGKADIPAALCLEGKSKHPLSFTFLDVQRMPVLGIAEKYHYAHRMYAEDDLSYSDALRFKSDSIARFVIRDLDAGELPYEDSTVEGIFFRYGMHWLNEPFGVVREFSRVLKPGRSAYIATSTPYSLSVMNEVFKIEDHSRDELAKRFPEAEVTETFSHSYGFPVWVVSHAKEIDRHFSENPVITYYQRRKSLDSIMKGRLVTGFTSKYFERVSQNYGMEVAGLSTERNGFFCNNFPDDDPRSKTDIHVLLRKPVK